MEDPRSLHKFSVLLFASARPANPPHGARLPPASNLRLTDTEDASICLQPPSLPLPCSTAPNSLCCGHWETERAPAPRRIITARLHGTSHKANLPMSGIHDRQLMILSTAALLMAAVCYPWAGVTNSDGLAKHVNHRPGKPLNRQEVELHVLETNTKELHGKAASCDLSPGHFGCPADSTKSIGRRQDLDLSCSGT